jgi:protease-4
MRNLARIAAKIYGEAWLIRGDVWNSITAQFQAIREGAKMAADDLVGPTFYGIASHPQVQVIIDVAVIPVHGIIGKHLSAIEMECGGYCLANLMIQLDNVRDDPKIRTVVIDFKTPGGIGIGVETAALKIRELAESGKRVIAYTDYDCCSAGYWLASACDEIIAERSAIVGSVSTYIGAIDDSEAWAKAGYKRILARTGDKKAIGMSGKEWTQEEIDYLTEKAKLADQKFKGFISTRRGLSDDLMQGQTWSAADAPPGVVDGLADSLEDVVSAAVGWK